MELFEKVLVPLGKHLSPEGEVDVTPDRVRHWVDSFNRLRARGVKLPMPWGHRQKSLPEESFDEAVHQQQMEELAAARARWNASYVERLSICPHTGGLMVACKPPPGYAADPETGDLVNPADGTRIGELSAGIGDWTDGRGRAWDDIIVHAAFVPLPVVPGQGGFEQIRLSASDRVVWRHQLSTRTGDTAMADEKKPDEKPEEKKGEEAETVEIPPEKPEEKDGAYVRVLGLLKDKFGIAIPDGTEKAKVWDMLEVAIMNKDAAAAPAATLPDPAADGAAPEQPPVMLSTRPGRKLETLTPREQKAAQHLARKERDRLKGEVDALQTLGCPVHVCEEYRQKITRQNMSLDPGTMAVSLPAVSGEIGALKRVLAELRPESAALIQTLSTATPDVGPHLDREKAGAEHEAWMKEQAERMYGPGAKPAKVG